jgi:acyl-coenzyme A thioesterase PaaI-like protein
MNLDFLEAFNLKNFDLIKASEKLPGALRLKALTTALDFAVPFNFGLGIEIEKLTPSEVVLVSPERRKRRNHVGSAHACFLALLSEYPAGLLIAQNFSFQKYRIIISKLEIEYFKQGRGELRGISKKPETEPVFTNGEAFLEMQTEIVNKQGERVSLCKTLWQIKEWSQVRKPKS